jgi:hypothetical protein
MVWESVEFGPSEQRPAVTLILANVVLLDLQVVRGCMIAKRLDLRSNRSLLLLNFAGNPCVQRDSRDFYGYSTFAAQMSARPSCQAK